MVLYVPIARISHKLRKVTQASVCLPLHELKADLFDLWKIG